MKLFKIKLFVIAAIMLAANSAFASLSYDVSLNTTSLNGQDGYLYLQYNPTAAVDSTATVFSSATDGLLASSLSSNVVDGSAVSGQLPGTVVFANTNGTNDYNQGIHFGNSISFSLLFASNAFGALGPGNSTFSLGLFVDDGGLTSLLGGTLFTISLYDDGTTEVQTLANEANVTPTPIPAAIYLLGSGLMGLVGIRRRRQK